MGQSAALRAGKTLSSKQAPRPARPGGEELRRPSARVMAVTLCFTAAVFVLDLMTPLGLPYWLLYGLSFFFIRSNAPGSFAYALAVLCTVLIFVGYLVSPEGVGEPVTERALAVIILWGVLIVAAPRYP